MLGCIFLWCLVPLVCGVLQTDPVPPVDEILGQCPTTPQDCKDFDLMDRCETDLDCMGTMKCCSSPNCGLDLRCMDPEKPGQCPGDSSQPCQPPICLADMDCGLGPEKCCQGCCSSPRKPGFCSPYSVQSCTPAQCQTDFDCGVGQEKCCNGCCSIPLKRLSSY